MGAIRRLTLCAAGVLAVLLAVAPPAVAGGSGWHLGYYTPSGRALSLASTSTGTGIASFDFTDQTNTALLVTNQGGSSLLGDDTGMKVSATFHITGVTGAFIYFGEPSCGSTTSSVRLFFQTSNAGGFDETHFWWSNPVSATLSGDTAGTVTITESLGDSSRWSDFFGHFGNDPGYAAGYANAVSNVTSIGLSFGGGCFFENGVGTSDGSGTFTLDAFSVGS